MEILDCTLKVEDPVNEMKLILTTQTFQNWCDDGDDHHENIIINGETGARIVASKVQSTHEHGNAVDWRENDEVSKENK